MRWNRIAAVVILALLSAMGGYQLKVHAQQFPKPCTVVIPAEWGKYKGVSAGSGLVFEDNHGTLRIISQLACNIDGTVASPPQVMVEIHRK